MKDHLSAATDSLDLSADDWDVVDDCFVPVEMEESCPVVLSAAVKGHPSVVTDSPDSSPADSGVADDCFVRVEMAELRLVVLRAAG